MKDHVFYLCEECGNLAGMIEYSGVTPECCGKPMTKLTANTTDASHEKHVPVITVAQGRATVAVGEIAHPMLDSHYIKWIYLQTTFGGHRRALKPGDAPQVEFMLESGEEPLAAFAYCNLHGLWKKDV